VDNIIRLVGISIIQGIKIGIFYFRVVDDKYNFISNNTKLELRFINIKPVISSDLTIN